jgi:putative ABC transport system permease protein
MNDLRLALRQLFKSPGFTATAVLTLALGIGTSTAIFSVVHTLLLSPLQYTAADELVQLQSRHQEQPDSGLAPATFGDFATTNHSFAAVAAHYYYYVNLTGTDTPALLNSAEATSDYFRLFAVPPLLGRTLTRDDFKAGATPAVVLGHSVWTSHYHSRESILGQQIMLDDVAHTIVGIMPATFKDPSNTAQLWRPMRIGADNLLDRSSRYWTVFGRLKSGVTLDEANSELAVISGQLAAGHPKNYEGWTIHAIDLRRLVVGDYQSGLLVVLGAVGCVMLIACVNVAGLSIVRAAARRKELAIRTALGTSRVQLICLLVTESMLLAVLGGAAGVLLASWGLDAFLASLPEGWMPRTDEITLNLPVLVASWLVALVTGLISGLAPGIAATRIDANEALKDGTRSSAGPSAHRLRSGLVITEIALALVLLAATGLLGRSFIGLLQKKTGVDAERVLSLTVSLSAKRYDSPAKCWDFFSRAEVEVAAVPGVDAAGFTHTSPFRWGIPIGYAPLGTDNVFSTDGWPQAFNDSVSVDYFKAVGIPLRAGRTFTPADDHKARSMVIVSETAARRYFGIGDPIGRFLTLGAQARFEVIGVVGDVRRNGLTSDIPLQVYRPLAQRTTGFATLMVRTALPPATLTKAVQSALWRVDPLIPISDIATMDTFVDRSVTQPRLYLVLFSLFAMLALGLAAIGLYGLIAYGVDQRTREFGIRAALGATPRAVLALVLREGTVPIFIGLAFGLIGAFLAVRSMQKMIFETALYDPLVFIAAPLLLTAIAAFACYIPARRATKVDPMIALRAE